ncbi:hypothetical protein QBC34DRAFT_487117 [Podospora aff. communis PSN243]|uniref:Protein NO VEIN C-terminal domain-containing protein n=1 Tax=Podospora aff. communis PSN243 TaxID=3040156 RepID=A0AAV9GCA1_9PEZI|nr:hypothetical protein QBC34DRAFT_487117 [Podospora aff. communis PSN243]
MAAPNRPRSREEARELVDKILESQGRPKQADWESITEKLTEAEIRVLELSFATKDRLIGSSVITLAQNLYTSNARFIFELLQNAEDNDYSEAINHGEAPKVTISLYPNHVVLECNENGFNDVNLTAICAIGESSKTAAGGGGGYIGNKGIGFKSVFMAADRVHIQSGHLCFRFAHKQGDSGMGMITPIWEEPVPSVGERCTRITLDLREGGSSEDRARRNQAIYDQLGDIHDAILLFMKKIQKLEICFYNEEWGEADAPRKVIIHSIERSGTKAVCRKRTSQLGQDIVTDVRHYHVTGRTATGLAKSQRRTYSNSEEASRVYSQGEVVLAFPVTIESVPVLDNQWLFAFLPVRQMGFKFLIHADFDTQANRQDIVTSSARNEGLAVGIADAFVKAVLQMCDHPTLLFQWMRYLPQQDAYPWDAFWKSLITRIKEQIQLHPVVAPAKPGPLRRVGECLRLTTDSIDRYGQPLLPDIPPHKYLSTKYESSDLDRLKDVGLRFMAMDEHILRARADIASTTSRIKTQVDEDWQTRIANFLHLPFRERWEKRIREVKELALLPLRSGEWTSTTLGPVYYANLEGADLLIPSGIGLRNVDPAAVANTSRKRLFDAVGVQNISAVEVRNLVARKCQSGPLTLFESVEYLQFLFLTQAFAAPGSAEPRVLRIFNHNGDILDGREADIYIRSDDRYGAAQLFCPTEPGSGPGRGAPGFVVSFVNDAYFEDPPSLPSPTEGEIARWSQWLTKVCVLTETVSIYDARRGELTPAGKYVSKHRPEKFMGLLRMNWEETLRSQARRDARIIDAIGQIPVLCRGAGVVALRPLKLTYLPLPDLIALCDRFMVEGEFFPWLELETSVSETRAALEWSALGSAFGLGYDRPWLELALVALQYIYSANSHAEESLARPQRMHQLYTYLQSKVDESSDPQECRKTIRAAFESERYLYIPPPSADAGFTTPLLCVWSAPVTLNALYVLQTCYRGAFSLTPDQVMSLERFFVHTLGIDARCGWPEIISEISWHKDDSENETRYPRATELYECLMNMGLLGDDVEKLKQAFSEEALIFSMDDNGQPAWHKPHDCLWSSATTIGGKFVLDRVYGDLKEFFVGMLGVSTMTAAMVYEKLTTEHDDSFTVAEAKETIMVFNSFLATDPGNFEPEPVRANRIFPVRTPGGRVGLRRGTDAFSLLDQKPLGEAFSHVANFLDCSLQELRILGPFIQWVGLGNRYLSASVKEITSADRESTRPISASQRQIKAKAHALLRIAAFFNSPRIKSSLDELYTFLRNSKILETESITAEILLTQGDHVYRVERDLVLVHFRESDDELAVYVPRDERRQEVCFNSKLPKRLCEWLMTDPTTQITERISPQALSAVQSVLNAKPFALEDILDQHGIGEVNVPNLDDDGMDQDNALVPARPVSPAVSGDGAEAIAVSPPVTPSPRRPAPSSHTEPESSDEEATAMATPLSPVASPAPTAASSYLAVQSAYASARPPLRPTQVLSPEPQDAYYRLLQNVVRAARSTAFPSQGIFNIAALRSALPDAAFTPQVLQSQLAEHYTPLRRKPPRVLGSPVMEGK